MSRLCAHRPKLAKIECEREFDHADEHRAFMKHGGVSGLAQWGEDGRVRLTSGTMKDLEARFGKPLL